MGTLVIAGDGTRVSLASRHLEIAGNEPLSRTTVPLRGIDRVVVCGRPPVSLPALLRFAAEGIPCFFLSGAGRWLASLHPDGDLNAARRILQYRRSGDPAFALSVARALVHAKIGNARRVLQRLAAARSRSRHPSLLATARTLREAARTALAAPSLQVLRGCEGAAAALYFSSLASFFPPAFPFRGRTRHPPRDPANALLSWTYALLLGEIESAIRSHGLDPAIGHLHADRLSSPSLALDLMEPFRPALADRLVLDLLNHARLDPARHFSRRADGAVLLSAEGKNVFFPHWERAMNRRLSPGKNRPSLTLRQFFDQTVLDYLAALERDLPPTFFRLP